MPGSRNLISRKSNSPQRVLPQVRPDSLSHLTSAQQTINSAIVEYLLKNGFMRSVDTIQEELLQNKAGRSATMLFDENTGIGHMLQAFE